ncbi:MAG: hypothetical protein ACI91R_000996 [Vicingaceae bacterium]|jgi:hypothetical protein
MKKGAIAVLLGLISASFFAQNSGVTGSRAYSLAGVATLQSDLWSANNNPAGLGSLKKWQGGISYENQFLLSELSNKTAIVTAPVSRGSFGLSINQFGYSSFNENRIGISFGQMLSKKISIGIQLNYLSTRIGDGYGETNALSGNIGLLAKINDELLLSAVVINPNRAKLAEFTDERFPTLIKLGVSYEFSKKVIVFTEVTKDIDYDANVRMAIEYKALKMLYFRAGYATAPSLTSFGFGLNVDKFKLDFASGFDANLGFSPQVSMSYSPSFSQQ